MDKRIKFSSPLYYCTECKTILSSLDQLLFIEEKSTKGFCSESCIEDFYMPFIRHFEKIEINVRTNLDLLDEKISTSISDKNLVDTILSAPDEIWEAANDLDEEIFTYVKHFNDFVGVVICKVYNRQASFVFLSTTTRSSEFLSEICTGNKINGPLSRKSDKKVNLSDGESDEGMDNFTDEDFSFMQLLENKKSTLLAELLEKRKDSDILFEDFTDYESSFHETLETPDEVFENKDKEGDLFFIYIKSFIKGSENFFYIISCLKRNTNIDSPEVNVFPVLGFPTNDLALYSEFRNGKRISSHLKN